MNFKLTKDQRAARKGITELLYDATPKTILLTGSAGTGKTTLCSEFQKNFDIQWAAMTHKACAILSEKIGTNVMTLARLLKARKHNNYDTGETTFVSAQQEIDVGKPIVFIDEVSMMNQQDFATVSKLLLGKYHVVFVGDKFQLPPVKEHLSEIFKTDVITFELKQPVRFEEGGDIEKLSLSIRDCIEANTPTLGHAREVLRLCNDIPWVKFEDAFPMMVSSFRENSGVDDTRVISFTNARVEYFNYYLKQTLTGDADKFKEGDLLLANEAYSEVIEGDERMILTNNQSVKVIKLQERQHFDMDAYRMLLNTGDWVYVPKDRNLYVQQVMKLKQEALRASGTERKMRFRKMFQFKEQFADLRLNYSQTVHKAQGSSYKYCFFDMEGVDSNSPMGRRLLYTGVTRAAEKLVLFK